MNRKPIKINGHEFASIKDSPVKADCSPQDHPGGRICQPGKGSTNV